MTTQRKHSWQLLLTTSSNLWQPKERILDNFFLQRVPTYDNPKKEFLTTSSYNKFQLMTTRRKNSWQLVQVTTSYNLWWQPKERISLQLVQVTSYDKPWNFVGFVCGVWESCSYEVWEIPSYPKNPEENLLWTAFPFFPICFAFFCFAVAATLVSVWRQSSVILGGPTRVSCRWEMKWNNDPLGFTVSRSCDTSWPSLLQTKTKVGLDLSLCLSLCLGYCSFCSGWLAGWLRSSFAQRVLQIFLK
jgi:hypothetical protein